MIIGCGGATDDDDGNTQPETPASEEDAMMFVTVQLTAEAARNLRQQSTPTAQVEEVLQIAEELDVTLEPMHPTVDLDSDLATYFTVTVHDAERGERVAERFRQAEASVAAYFKLPGERPEDSKP
jgi:hypothetical protein